MFHKENFVTVSDETSHPKEFLGLLLGPCGAVGETQWVATFVTDSENGFGWPVGCAVNELKHLGDGKFGA